MALNCKPGDLALVISGPSAGKLVTCLEPLPAGWYRDDLPRGCSQQINVTEGPLWRVNLPLEWGDLLYLAIAPDEVLMPLGPGSPEKASQQPVARQVEA